MMEMREKFEEKVLRDLCEKVRSLVAIDNYSECRRIICNAMGEYPDAAQPHNLMGVMMEKQGNHVGAMKHFRAARGLDPTYIPARENMEGFGAFECDRRAMF